MSKRHELYTQKDMLEIDKAYIEIATPGRVKGHLKRGNGSNTKAVVGVSAKSNPLEVLKTGKTSRFCGYSKMEVFDSVEGEHVKQFIEKNVEKETVLITNNNMAYSQLKDIFQAYFTIVSGKDTSNDTLRWVHKSINNLKLKLPGIKYMIAYIYLQNYLNKFVYKLNPGSFGQRLYDRLIIAPIHQY